MHCTGVDFYPLYQAKLSFDSPSNPQRDFSYRTQDVVALFNKVMPELAKPDSEVRRVVVVSRFKIHALLLLSYIQNSSATHKAV